MSDFQEQYELIDWHDIPVERISIDGKKKSFSIVFAIYNDAREQYEYNILEFTEILSIETTKGNLIDLLSFDSKYDLEINSSSYSKGVDNIHKFEILILLGSTKPVINFKIQSKQIDLRPAL